MNIMELLLIAIGLSMDAFAVAVCYGLSMKKAVVRKAAVVGLYFGVFQALMPLLGYTVARRFADDIRAFDHWIAFVLLAIIGGRMVYGSFQKEGCSDRDCPAGTCKDRVCPNGVKPNTKEASVKPSKMLPLAMATSVDAMAVGVSFAFLQVAIAPAALSIGLTTFVLSVIGTKVGNAFGMKFKSKAEFAGGVILVLLGLKILLEHTIF